MKPIFTKLIALSLSVIFCAAALLSCTSRQNTRNQNSTLFDSQNKEVAIPADTGAVVAVGASLADLWLLSGGGLSGTTSDAVEQGLNIGSAQIVGTMRDPSTEAIIGLSPGLVLLSSDIPSHAEIAEVLGQADISCFMAKNDSFEDYYKLLDKFTDITGKKQLMQTYGEDVKKRIQSTLQSVPSGEAKTVLLLRASSTEVKAKYKDNATARVLDELGTVNAAAGNSLLESLSLEAIIDKDPDYIFVVTMGSNTDKANQILKDSLTENPAWQTLSAVKNGRFEILPKELFHYKPNAKWGEAYEYLYKRIYGA